jgi:hypothetical protein
MTSRRRFRWILIAVGAVFVAALGVGAYFLWSAFQLPGPDSPIYREYVEDFQYGLAAMDTERSLEIGGPRLDRAVQLVPEEPAGWANRGLMYLRDGQKDRAAADLAKAHALAPQCAEIEALLGWLAKQLGKYTEAVGHFRRAVQAHPRDLSYLFALAQAVRQENRPDADAEYQRLIEEGLKVQPNNLFLLRERLGVAVRRADRAGVIEVIDRLRAYDADWKEEQNRRVFADFVEASKGELPGRALDDYPFLFNTMPVLPGWETSLAAVRPTEEGEGATALMGEPVARFVRLAPMPVGIDPPDLHLTLTPGPVPNAAGATAQAAWVVWLTRDECAPAVFFADAAKVGRADASLPPLPFPGGPNQTPPSRFGLVPADVNFDFRTDLLLAGAGGLRLYMQAAEGAFLDATDKLPADVRDGDYFGAWAADVDMDGDLDFVLAPRSGPPIVLRNNGDGTFQTLKGVFPGVSDIRDFVWADFDHDGAPDAAFLDAHGKTTVLLNQRHTQFNASPLPALPAEALALAVADVNDDGDLDLLVFAGDGVVRRLSDASDGQWTSAELARWDGFSPGEAGPGAFALLTADLDNNGALDLIAATPNGARIWMGAGPDKFEPLPAAISERIFAVADLSDAKGRRDGLLDLLGLSPDGRLLQISGGSALHYHSQEIRPIANKAEKGDNRINSFCIGAEAEMRAGFLIQKQVVVSPVLHFGLGTHEIGQLLRFVWPNGDPQVEFADTIAAGCPVVEQRLHGSCPFLFTWDGDKMQFVKDILWSSPLGLYINAQDRGGISQTTEWAKVRGDQLKPRDGLYNVRITADLWETHYFDHVHLTAVDHPADTEMYVDERFFLTPTAPRLYLTKPPRPVAKAVDEHGDDVTDVVRKIDGRYLNTFDLGKYQGVAEDHYVEVDLGDDAPKTGPVYLLATGWIHPTNSSINTAIEQGSADRPHGLVLEIPDGKGGWTVGRPALGFPSGKNKTIVIRLDGIPGQAGVARRFRLRTNMEIYWDALEYAEGLDAGSVRQSVLAPETAELRHRGISRITAADASSPELPDYDKLESRSQYWRDLIGWYTRYGDVRELLEKTDDRYVIMNAGDEIAMKFHAPADPPPGWKRDFVWVSDGWEKDGDFNTRFSKTVLPLPYHGMTNYETPPGRLEDDPIYKRFPNDWKNYHTRYVTPYMFERGLRLNIPP